MTDNTIMNKRARKKQRQEQAAERAAARAARSDREQLNILWDRGINCGREWDRLTKRIEAEESSKKSKKNDHPVSMAESRRLEHIKKTGEK